MWIVWDLNVYSSSELAVENKMGVELDLTLREIIIKKKKKKQYKKQLFLVPTLLSETFPEGFLKKEVLAVKKYSSESSSKLL